MLHWKARGAPKVFPIILFVWGEGCVATEAASTREHATFPPNIQGKTSLSCSPDMFYIAEAHFAKILRRRSHSNILL